MADPAAVASIALRAPALPPARTGGAEVVLLGEALVAFLANDGLPLRSATQFRRTVVGSEFNVAVGLARLGHPVLFCGRVGNDALGEVVADVARGCGVATELVGDPEATTGVLVRDVSASRPVAVQYARTGSAGSRLAPSDLPRQALDRCRVLHVSGITAALSSSADEAVGEAVHQVRSAGGAVCFDPNVRWRLMHPDRSRSALLRLVDSATVLLAGVEELAWLSQRTARTDAARWALDRGVSLVVVKDGAQGAWVTDGSTTVSVPALPVAAVDPVGAGDAFAAGFLSGLLRGRPVEDSLTEAASVAALVVATPGDIEGLPDADQRDGFVGLGGQVNR